MDWHSHAEVERHASRHLMLYCVRGMPVTVYSAVLCAQYVLSQFANLGDITAFRPRLAQQAAHARTPDIPPSRNGTELFLIDR